MTDNVIRFADYERKSRDADAVSPRDPCDAAVIVLPVIRKLNAPAPKPVGNYFATLPGWP